MDGIVYGFWGELDRKFHRFCTEIGQISSRNYYGKVVDKNLIRCPKIGIYLGIHFGTNANLLKLQLHLNSCRW